MLFAISVCFNVVCQHVPNWNPAKRLATCWHLFMPTRGNQGRQIMRKQAFRITIGVDMCGQLSGLLRIRPVSARPTPPNHTQGVIEDRRLFWAPPPPLAQQRDVSLGRYSSVDRAAETLLLTDASAAETADAPADAPVEPEPKRPRTE